MTAAEYVGGVFQTREQREDRDDRRIKKGGEEGEDDRRIKRKEIFFPLFYAC